MLMISGYIWRIAVANNVAQMLEFLQNIIIYLFVV